MQQQNLSLSFILLLITSIISFAIPIIFIVFSIISMLEPIPTCSNLWYYVLIANIFVGISLIFNILIKKDTNIGCINCLLFFMSSIGMIIWGGYELFHIKCNINNTDLYKIALSYWIGLLFMYLILFVYLIFLYTNKNSVEANYENTNLEKV
jgi:hypothetical protein